MNNKDFVLAAMREQGRKAALDLQDKASEMTGTELNAEDGYIPNFTAAKDVKNMLSRPIGFVCKSTAGRVVKLIQPYDSNIYTTEPEELPAQWAFMWSTDPKKALPFIAFSTSPYMKNDCCIFNEQVFRSKMDNNVFSPEEYPQGWDEVN